MTATPGPSTSPQEGRPSSLSRRSETIAVVGMLGMTIIVVSSIAGWKWAGSAREDFAQWIMAGATVATLLAAVAAAVFAAGAYNLEVQREDRHNDDRRKAQAERFAAWCGEGIYEIQVPGRESLGGFPIDVIYLRNVSDLPVSAVYAVVRAPDGESMGTIDIGLVPPASEPISRAFTQEIAESVDAARRAYDAKAETKTDSIVIPPAFVLGVELWFTDTAGQTWRRQANGQLKDI